MNGSKAQLQPPPGKRKDDLIPVVLCPRDDETVSPTFTVAGSYEANGPTLIQVSVDGTAEGSKVDVADFGWTSADVVRGVGSHSASAAGGGNSNTVSFTVADPPLFTFVSPPVVAEDPPPPPPPGVLRAPSANKVAATVGYPHDVGPVVTARLMRPDGTEETKGTVHIFPNGKLAKDIKVTGLPKGVYALVAKYENNDTKLEISRLVRAKHG